MEPRYTEPYVPWCERTAKINYFRLLLDGAHATRGPKTVYLVMEEINPRIQGVRMTSHDNGNHHLILVAPNALWADVLLHTLGDKVVLGYLYDGYDITFYLVLEIPHLDRMFKISVNAARETKKWLGWIEEKLIASIWVAYTDGKGGVIPFGKSIKICTDGKQS